ncbi:MAG TPA: polysaccharide deacetylase family protein [Gaiellaceae bacterium]|nr:polysaccharide deacetylase family protein [Gaiellaceae bacterium]
MDSRGAVLHALALPGGDELRPLGEPQLRVAARVAGGVEVPEGAAWPEAIAARLRGRSTPVTWGAPVVPASPRELERLSYERGRSAVDVLRADPQLLTSLQIGTWFSAAWHARLVRRLLLRAPLAATIARAAVPRRPAVRLAADVWFWAGVRSRATRREWRRLTQSSYVAFCYHQLAGTMPNTEHDIDLVPAVFERQMLVLRRLGWKPLSLDEVYAFHTDAEAVLPRRRYLLTADDGYVEAVDMLVRHADTRPVAFVVTRLASGEQTRPGTSFADWGRLAAAHGAGVAVGSHTRSHPSLVACSDESLAGEVAGARADFEAAGIDAAPVFAYPFGHHDERVRGAAIDAGYRLAYTSVVGRNGAGTDPWRLRRITIHGRDRVLAFAWKVLTGESLPGPFARRQERRRARSAG